MKLLVTGASGGIGQVLIQRLARRGELRLLSRQPREGAHGRWVGGDLREPSGLDAALEGVDVVLHLAALTHSARPREYFAVNAEGTRNLIAAAERAGVRRFVHVSTRALGRAGGAYSHSKELAEEVVQRSSLPWVVLRPAEVYGVPGRDPVLALARSLERQRFVLLLGDGSHRLSPVFAGDLVPALESALDETAALGRSYVLAGPEELSYLELVERCERVLGLAPRTRIHVPLFVARAVVAAASRIGRGPYVPDQLPRLALEKCCDISPARRDLGFAPRPLEERLPPLLGLKG